jgi:hypothetical protein
MSGHPRLALPEQLRDLPDRKLHAPQQGQDSQPRRVGKRLEKVGKGNGFHWGC